MIVLLGGFLKAKFITLKSTSETFRFFSEFLIIILFAKSPCVKNRILDFTNITRCNAVG